MRPIYKAILLGAAAVVLTAANVENIAYYLKGTAAGYSVLVSGETGSSSHTSTLPPVTGTVASTGFGSSIQVGATSPTNPSGTTGVGQGMMGYGKDAAGSGAHPCAFTPQYSSRVMITFNFTLLSANAGDNVYAALYAGTGTAPSNAANATGTQLTNDQNSKVIAAPITLSADFTGLTPGTAIWADILVGSNTASNLASSLGVDCHFVEH